MIKPMKRMTAPALLVVLFLFHTSPVQARGDDVIQRDIEEQITESRSLRDARIKVYVEERLVVLTGHVKLYEQKLISERIAWTTSGVLEVDNEVQVIPKLPLSDAAIERKIREIVKAHARLHDADVVAVVDSGFVTIEGSFSGISDPVFIKHRIAEIEGVLGINIRAKFLAFSR